MIGIITVVIFWLIIRHLLNKKDEPQFDYKEYNKGRTRAEVDDARMRQFARHIAHEASKRQAPAPVPAPKPSVNKNAVDAEFEEVK